MLGELWCCYRVDRDGFGLVVGVRVSWSAVGTGRKMITSAIRGESPSGRR